MEQLIFIYVKIIATLITKFNLLNNLVIIQVKKICCKEEHRDLYVGDKDIDAEEINQKIIVA